MCLSVNYGKVDISIFFKFDPMSEDIPTKGDTHEISKFLDKETLEVENLRDIVQNLFNEEHIHFVYNVDLNNKLINVTLVESLIILMSFLIEYCTLSQYLRNKDLI